MRGLLLALVLLSGCVSREQTFWKWFGANAARIAAFESDQKRVFDDLERHLAAVDRHLAFEIGPKGTPRELVISADGNIRAFPAVRALVAAAPPIPGWKVIAFRQRKPIGLRVEAKGASLGPDDIWFSSQPRDGKLDAVFFVKGLTRANRDQLAHPGFLLLDSALGEYDVETKLGSIEFEPMPAEDRRDGLRPFRELPAVVDGMK